MAGISVNNPNGGEYGFGEGHFPHPESDYQQVRQLPIPHNALTNDRNYQNFVAGKRLDPLTVDERVEDMFFVEGNADLFGPGPKLVKEDKRVGGEPIIVAPPIPGQNRQG